MHVVYSHCCTEIDAVFDVSADVEVVFADIAPLPLLHIINLFREVSPIATFFIFAVAHQVAVKIVELCEFKTVGVYHTILAYVVVEYSLIAFGGRNLALRTTVGHACGIEQLVKVTVLGVVERKIEEGVTSCTHAIDEACLVEAGVCLVCSVNVGCVLLRDESESEICCGVTEKSYACRVSSDGRDVGTQCLHCTTHSHIACCSA